MKKYTLIALMIVCGMLISGCKPKEDKPASMADALKATATDVQKKTEAATAEAQAAVEKAAAEAKAAADKAAADAKVAADKAAAEAK